MFILFLFGLYFVVVLALDLYVFFKIKSRAFGNIKTSKISIHAFAGPFVLPYLLLFDRDRLMLLFRELHRITKPDDYDSKEDLSLLHKVSGFFVK